MRMRLMASIGVSAVILSAYAGVQYAAIAAEAPAASAALKTPWDEPDLQGIWTAEFDTPLQRPAKFATQEFFTVAQREEMDQARAALFGSNERAERGTERDVSG